MRSPQQVSPTLTWALRSSVFLLFSLDLFVRITARNDYTLSYPLAFGAGVQELGAVLQQCDMGQIADDVATIAKQVLP